MTDPINFKCPICGLLLVQEEGSYHCQNTHAFDVAKEGYLNLLPVQQKNSKNPGDNEEMARSRQDFLDKGYYSSLAERIVELIENKGPLLDAGCGEGYYLGKLRSALGLKVNLVGIDISKPMIRLAARRKLSAVLAVGSNYKLPFFDGSFGAIISIFAPISSEEIARTLRSDGIFIMVGPGENHLAELVTELFGSAVPHKGNYQAISDQSLKLDREERLTKQLTVAPADLNHLLTMTPYGWHANSDKKEHLAKSNSLKVTTDFIIRTYRKA